MRLSFHTYLQTAKEDTSTHVLIIANIISLLLAIYLEWDVFNIIFLYWFETLIIGFFAVIKMTHLVMTQAIIWKLLRRLLTVALLIGFFLLHFGGFMFVHLIFIRLLFGATEATGDLSSSIVLMSDTTTIFGFIASSLILFISHSYSFWYNYLQKREYIQREALDYFASPYDRIAIMHLTIMIGGGLALLLNSYLALVLLASLKILADVHSHITSHTIKKDTVQIN